MPIGSDGPARRQRLDRIVEAAGTRVLDYRPWIGFASSTDVQSLDEESDDLGVRTDARSNARYAMPRESLPSLADVMRVPNVIGFALPAAAAVRPTRNGRMT